MALVASVEVPVAVSSDDALGEGIGGVRAA